MSAVLPSSRQSSSRPSFHPTDASVAVVALSADPTADPATDPYLALIAAVRAASAAPATRVIVLPDLAHPETPGSRLTVEDLRTRLGALTALAGILPALPQPVVGVAAGPVTDHGCLLAASCDLVVAAPEATFGLVGARDGVPPSVPTLALASAVGRRAAVALATAATPVDAARAHTLGLVTHLAATDGPDGPDAVGSSVAALVDSLLALDPTVVALGRSVLPTARVGADDYEAAIEATMCARGLLADPDPTWIDETDPAITP